MRKSAVGYGALTNLLREDVMGELRLGLGGGLPKFPGGKPFCLVCGGAPAGNHRVFFEQPDGSSVAVSRVGSVATGVEMIKNRIVFSAPLCAPHLARAGQLRVWTFAALAGGIVLAGILMALIAKTIGLESRVGNVLSFIAIGAPFAPMYFLWRAKDRGGLACTVRIEEEELVLVYAGRVPSPT